MIEVALILAAVTLVVGIGAALCLRLLPTVRLQVTGLALLAVVLPLVAVLASGWVMFHMHDDAKILAVSSAAALSAVVGALLLGRWIVGPLERLRATSGVVAGGDLAARAVEQGPHELVELAAAFNKMAGSIERLFESRRQLVAGASHDLRTPLASLQAMLEALEDGLAEPDEYLPAIRDQVRILSTLVDGRSRPSQPAHQRSAPHPRLRHRRRRGQRAIERRHGCGRRQRSRAHRRGCAANVRALLASRSVTDRRWLRTGSCDRARFGRG